MAAKFSAPIRSSSSISSGHRDSPFSSPWVSEASANPPFRPLAPQPQRSPSSSTTSSPGAAYSAAHSPVKPPPTIARSQRTSPSSGGSGSGAAGESSQKTFCSESASARLSRGAS